jgi:hypothetical protein
MYDQAKMEVARGERQVQRMEFKEKHLLPLDTSDLKISAPPTPTPISKQPISSSSATEKNIDFGPPRRRSSSFTERERTLLPPPPLHANWNLGSITEMTPPLTPPHDSLVQPKSGRPQNSGAVRNGHRRVSSANVYGLQGKAMDGIQKGLHAARIGFPQEVK